MRKIRKVRDGINEKTLITRFAKGSLKPKAAVKPKPPPKPINSRQKGQRGERELAGWLRDRGIEARRGQQFKGGAGSPDVVAGGCLEGIHIEVKFTQSTNIYPWYEQASRDAGMFKIPLVAHRKNGKPWLAIMDLRDVINLLAELAARPPEPDDDPHIHNTLETPQQFSVQPPEPSHHLEDSIADIL